jgi:hypothetical protein
MERFLTNLVRAIQQLGSRRRAPSVRRVCLNVETMEERMVPSAVAVIPELSSAQADGGIHHVVAPDRPVYGYKHRRRWPLATQATGAQAEGRVIRSENPHLVVLPPEGPLPTEFPGLIG